MEVIAAQFEQLAPVTRDVLLMDYIEEMVAETVGAERTYAFLRFCFAADLKYYVTEGSDKELWN
jgi:hypothetical protein